MKKVLDDLKQSMRLISLMRIKIFLVGMLLKATRLSNNREEGKIWTIKRKFSH